MKIAIFWGDDHTLPDKCDRNTWYSFYNSGWKYGFESLGHTIDYFAWGNNESMPGYGLYIYAPGFLSHKTLHKNLHKPNIFFTEEPALPVPWAVAHSYHYDSVCVLDWLNYKALSALGLENIHWVPGAADPTVFNILQLDFTLPSRKYDVAFLGTYDSEVIITDGMTRLNYIRGIDKDIQNSLVGCGYYAFEANKFWNSTKIGLDVPVFEFYSPRIFHIIAAGAFLITRQSRMPAGLEDLLPRHSYYATYRNYRELIEVILPYWIDKTAEREARAEDARKHVLKNHTFKERAEHLLEIVYGGYARGTATTLIRPDS